MKKTKTQTQGRPEQEPFLSRWSRRKQARRPEEEADEPLPKEVGPEEPPALLCDEDMPPLETLTEASDYRGFMSSGVSAELRRLALRKLFRSAGFNDRDGLDDYDGDFSRFEALGDLVTADMRQRMIRETEERLRQATDQSRPGQPEPIAGEAPSSETDAARSVAQGPSEPSRTRDDTAPSGEPSPVDTPELGGGRDEQG